MARKTVSWISGLEGGVVGLAVLAVGAFEAELAGLGLSRAPGSSRPSQLSLLDQQKKDLPIDDQQQ